MKSVRAAGSESDDELTSGPQASSDPGGPVVPADPNHLGVRMQADPEAGSPSSPDQLAPVRTSLKESSADAAGSSATSDQQDAKAGEQSSSGQDADDELDTTETLGQLTQRHRREMKLHKDRMKNLGKKKKDEIRELDREIEERHAAELAAAEARQGHKQPTPAEATVASLSAGLYSTKLTADQPSDRKEPTRAQKRRELRALEEAERDVRIEEEQADMGESDKAAEERQLMAELEPLGLYIREIPPDGNCLFRAVEDQVELAGPRDGSGSAGSSIHGDLRQQAASHMLQHPHDYLPFVIQDASGSGGLLSLCHQNQAALLADLCSCTLQMSL
ncbi:hypothetical protein WJX84_000480 [Apatococcus fuscideae]|uniref:OTU domain-containing protein n=1 Tax=Apatococcus fuscideae TaxID=2026836 RepID=A0AAW1SZA6_9CHLO